MSRQRETYFIQMANGPVKIGISTVGQTVVRLRDLQCGNPYVLMLRHVIAGDREEEMHYRFRDLHIGGEWFHPGPRLCAYANCQPEREIDLLMVDAAHAEGFKAGWRRAGEVLSEAADAVSVAIAEEAGRVIRRELVRFPEEDGALRNELERTQSGRRPLS